MKIVGGNLIIDGTESSNKGDSDFILYVGSQPGGEKMKWYRDYGEYGEAIVTTPGKTLYSQRSSIPGYKDTWYRILEVNDIYVQYILGPYGEYDMWYPEG